MAGAGWFVYHDDEHGYVAQHGSACRCLLQQGWDGWVCVVLGKGSGAGRDGHRDGRQGRSVWVVEHLRWGSKRCRVQEGALMGRGACGVSRKQGCRRNVHALVQQSSSSSAD